MSNREFKIEEFEIGQNLYIDASAGTGKTYTIQQLVAKLVGEGIPLSKILIVTYTEKAAGELRDRIRKKMEECLSSHDDAYVEKKKFYQFAVQNIHTAPISTFHSFCQKILHDFAYESKSSMNVEMVDDGNIKDLIEQLIRDKWANESDFIQLLDNEEFNQSDFLKEFANAASKKLLDKEIKCVIPDFSSLEGILQTIPEAKNAWNVLQKNNGISYKEDKSRAKKYEVSKFINSLENYNGKDYLKGFGSKWLEINWPSTELKTAIEFFKDIKKSPAKSSEIFIFNHIDEVVNLWQAQKATKKIQSFSDMINSVHNEVTKESSSLTQKIRDTYRYAVIDEFQDTNQYQWDIFKTIFLDSPHNNIIVVGDPKQSIYAFQGADVDVYRNAILKIGNGRILKTNYRSTDKMIQACNLLFGKSTGKSTDFEPDFDKGMAFFENEEFVPSSVPQSGKKENPTLNGFDTEPLWIAPISNENDFAKFVTAKIVECCRPISDGSPKTALQIYDKDKKALRNVNFSDFAILTRTRTEMPVFEEEMTKVGIPFTRYKDSKLFSGRECRQWLSLLKALDTSDFSGWNRKYLNEALITDFFRIPLDQVTDESFTYANNKVMELFIEWRKLVKNRQWATLEESIYKETQIDSFLCNPKNLQSLAKTKQIGSYIFNYLYNNKVSLEELIKHLQGLSNCNESADETDGNLVAKGSDFKTINLMTIHASKGLAFPIVIVAGGSKGDNNQRKGPFSFKTGDIRYMGFDNNSKAGENNTVHKEYRRLMYVAYTRAESLMIIPQYNKGDKFEFSFLKTAIAHITNNIENSKDSTENSPIDFSKFVRKNDPKILEELAEDSFEKNLEKQVKAILNSYNDQSIDDSESNAPDLNKLESSVNKAAIFQFSYSNLTQKSKRIVAVQDEDVSDIDGERFNSEDAPETSDFSDKEMIVNIDSKNVIEPCHDLEWYDESSEAEKEPGYPQGANLGNALHKVFENLDFEVIGNLSQKEAQENLDLKNLIIDTYRQSSIPIDKHESWQIHTANILWNTMNAKLPEIHGNKATGGYFHLKEIPAKNRLAEMEFNLNADIKDNLKKSTFIKRLCKGFIDLLFVRKDENGNEYYSILDWKSDVMQEYSNKDDSLSKKIKEDYSIQRVLYSYLLIIWLRQFYGKKDGASVDDETIFEQHFGGIYYALARGTQKGTCNGIYAQTWKFFGDLKAAFDNIKKMMSASTQDKE